MEILWKVYEVKLENKRHFKFDQTKFFQLFIVLLLDKKQFNELIKNDNHTFEAHNYTLKYLKNGFRVTLIEVDLTF